MPGPADKIVNIAAVFVNNCYRNDRFCIIGYDSFYRLKRLTGKGLRKNVKNCINCNSAPLCILFVVVFRRLWEVIILGRKSGAAGDE